MNLQSLIKIKLENELTIELNNYYDNKLSEYIPKNKFIQIYQKLIQIKINENEITIDPPKNFIVDKRNQCCARSMGKRYSDIRCSFKSHENSDYCKTHLNRINQYGYLSFGRYDQPRPMFNEKRNKIPWRDNSTMEDINSVIQYQNMNLLKLINKNKNLLSRFDTGNHETT